MKDINEHLIKTDFFIQDSVKEGSLILSKFFKNKVLLIVDSPVGKYEISGYDYFDALINLRLKLEHYECYPLLNGCRKNFYVSNMSRQMSCGRVGYFLEKNTPATRKVRTFDKVSEDLNFSTVKEQHDFYLDWLKSIKY